MALLAYIVSGIPAGHIAAASVIVAVHALDDKATKVVTCPIVLLYVSFSTYTALRLFTFMEDTNRVYRELVDPSIDFFEIGGSMGFGVASTG